MVIWRFTDGKAGHEAQTRGLVQALADLNTLETHHFATVPTGASLFDLLLRRCRSGTSAPDPDLIIGAGSATHLPMLAAKRARGGRLIVLMRPSLPLSWFDLVVAPEHDGIKERGNMMVTRGALTDVRPSSAHDPANGLILAGGPSAHFRWSDEQVVAQVVSIVEETTGVRWTLTTSRRTPSSFLPMLAARAPSALDIVPVERTDRSWLLDALAQAGTVWVSADSMSMVCDAVTSGGAVGLIDLPGKCASRVARGMAGFESAGLVTTYAAWRHGARPAPPAVPFNEAARVAAEIQKLWPAPA